MKNRIMFVVIVSLILIAQLSAIENTDYYGNRNFRSLLYPLPIPTLFGVNYNLIDPVASEKGETPIAPFINFEFGRFYNIKRSYSFQIRPSLQLYDPLEPIKDTITGERDEILAFTPCLHAFINHRWHLMKDVTSYEDLNGIILGAGLGGYAVTDKQDNYIFGPAINLKVTGWWFTKFRGVFEIDLSAGLIDQKEKNTDTRNLLHIIEIAFGQTVKDSAGNELTAVSLINKKATNIGVTLGLWAPLDWSWLFPED